MYSGRRTGAFGALVVAALAAVLPASAASELKPSEVTFFEKQIRPILVEHCYECHSAEAEKVKGGLLLDSRAAWELGGDSGPPILPGDPEGSLLIKAVRYHDPDVEMPPKKKLSDRQIAALERWIKIGAPDPREGGTGLARAASEFPVSAGQLWSLQPVDKNITPPPVKNESWPASGIDRFVLAKLEDKTLAPVEDADPVTLLRRLSFDLTGLPPTPEQVAAFTSGKIDNLVDELLASPEFGVRWGRHWLDVVRYAESNGKSRDRLMPHAWRYRDYVFASFNADLPFDRFITEQIAGDLLDADSPAERDRLRTATGLLALGAKTVNAPKGQYEMDLVDDQLDVIGQGILGLTVACARCHDHKFDPIPTADYYALAGIFRSTQPLYGRSGKDSKAEEFDSLHVLGPDAEKRGAKARETTDALAEIGKEKKASSKQIAAVKKTLPKDWEARAKEITDESTANESAGDSKEDQIILEYVGLQEEQRERTEHEKSLNEKLAALNLEYAMGARDAGKPVDVKIHIRGDVGNLGDEVPRAFLSSIPLANTREIDPEQSGRLEFASWLTNPDHPLTARVAVNRVWQHLFGRGLVSTVDNFGINGEAPSHPELLDYLANRFIENNWSIKTLIRDIVTSRTYQLSSTLEETRYAADPGNIYLWRMNRKKLEAEPLRDAILAASGELEAGPPPFGSAVAQIGNAEVGRKMDTAPLHQPWPWRTAYLPIVRTDMPEYLKLFDFPEPSNPQGLRNDTNVPSQALYLMNNSFVIDRAAAIAKRAAMKEKDQAARLEYIFHLCYGRDPTPAETERLLAFVKKVPENRAERWTTLCQTLIASAEFRYLN